MLHRYLPMTEEDKKEMLAVIGVDSSDELFEDIPESVKFKGELAIKEAASETELLQELTELSAKNANTKEYVSFLGAGVYNHYIPTIVDHVISRSEFYTAYTPYQPEISQGELQAIFEFQTMICELTGMDVANSSMYDGGTALAEAAMLASAHTRNKVVLVSKGVHPEYRDVLKTYAIGQRITVKEIEIENGVTSLTELEKALEEDVACIITQYPNFFGSIEPLAEIKKKLEDKKALFIVSSNPLALGVLTPPAVFGADIVVGDAQPFGIPSAYGGPHCGYFTTTTKLMRKIPGRLVGETVDENGKRGYVLTLQAREQHIRRDKATSNICSNQALNALAASVAMTALGREGVKQIAKDNISKSHYAKQELEKAGFTIVHSAPFFNEFVVKLSEDVNVVNEHLLSSGIIGGYNLSQVATEYSNCMLVAVTEQISKNDIDRFIEEMRDYK